MPVRFPVCTRLSFCRLLPSVRPAMLLALLFTCIGWSGLASAQSDPPIPSGDIRVHYHRTDGNYSGWTIYAFYDTTENQGNYGGGPVQVTGTDSYGAYFDVGVISGAQNVGLIIHNPTAPGGDIKDPGVNEFVDPTTEGNEYWAYTGIGKLYKTPPSLSNPTALLPGYARIHYYRPDGNYTNWTCYSFEDTAEYTGDFNDGLTFATGYDFYGAYFDISLIANAQNIGVIVHNVSSGTKDPGPNQYLNVATYLQGWVISGDDTLYTSQPSPSQLLQGVFNQQQAYWIDRNHILVQPGDYHSNWTYFVNGSYNGGITLGTNGVQGGLQVPLTVGGTLSSDTLARYPQLASYQVLSIPTAATDAQIAYALKGQLALSATTSDGALQYATGLQIGGVLDDLFYYSGKLGVIYGKNGNISLKLWAPTAQSVSVQLFQNPTDTTPVLTLPMTETNGVWTATGDQRGDGLYYLYAVTLYVPAQQAVVTNITTDPYSIDLALNGTMSRITNLDSSATKPPFWDEVNAPPLASLNDMSIYELHVRDFSVGDPSVPAVLQGTYDAFALPTSNGVQHLHQLAQAGLKAIHIMPSFHFASVNEDKSTWQMTPNLNGLPPASQTQQADVAAVQANDAYNWGYDPVHYLAPEGSYAYNPYERVLEYRVMVEALHASGLRVIQDVVFNHTNAAGQATNSNLDEVVPNYYHRYDANGVLENTSCCPDTASEHKMFEKLEIDTLVLNAKEYKIDGFRFDEMYQNFLYDMQDIKNALTALTVEKDGVDGSKIYIYGEGFNAGGTANNAIGPAASQLNLYGYGIGTFNDRIRDGVRGGGPFSDERIQGFATGLATDPSAYTTSVQTSAAQITALLQGSDWIRVGLTGNLRDYEFTDYTGATVTGAQVSYNGVPTGYTATPIEAVNYASVHDNQILFDAVQLKASYSDDEPTRARRQVLANSIIELGQGIPFFAAGDDLLRSKDMDQNSYDSGDWFNKIDWSGNGDNWGIGLPIASQNQAQWSFMTPLLSGSTYTPSPSTIEATTKAFQDFLNIRYSSRLFRMATFDEIQQNLTYLNTGVNQTPGLIVMLLEANGRNYGKYQHILVVFNGTNTQQTFTDSRLRDMHLALDPIQANGSDPVVKGATSNSSAGSVTVPALTTAVFVK